MYYVRIVGTPDFKINIDKPTGIKQGQKITCESKVKHRFYQI